MKFLVVFTQVVFCIISLAFATLIIISLIDGSYVKSFGELVGFIFLVFAFLLCVIIFFYSLLFPSSIGVYDE